MPIMPFFKKNFTTFSNEFGMLFTNNECVK
jgi:hypothetical protein